VRHQESAAEMCYPTGGREIFTLLSECFRFLCPLLAHLKVVKSEFYKYFISLLSNDCKF